MKFLRKFNEHTSYEEKLNVGGVDNSLPNVSYCKDVDDVHFNPYNLIEFYVDEITEPQTVKIYTDSSTSIDVTVSKGNKWYSYLLQKDKGLCKIEGDSVKKVVVKADISFEGILSFPLSVIIPSSTIEASFKGSNTSKVTNMSHMFYECRDLTSLDLSSFDTSNVTDMSIIFGDCSGLSSLTLSNFDTSKVTAMNGMFANCSSLKSLNISNFNTSNVINMSNMFGDCSCITSLDLSNFVTSNVTDMSNMFSNCSGLSSLTLSNFDTSKVSTMGSMFSYCTNITSLNLSKFNTSNVIDMNHMFDGCTNLISLDISGWNTSKVNSISKMFKGCSSETIGKIQTQLTTDGITGAKITTI